MRLVSRAVIFASTVAAAGCIDEVPLGPPVDSDLVLSADDDGEADLPPGLPGSPAATCAIRIGGVDNRVDWDTQAWTATAGHTTGRWYFEVAMERFEDGWATFGVAASPSSIEPAALDDGEASGRAVLTPGRGDTLVGVEVDLDGRLVTFRGPDGVLATRSVLQTDGMGPYVPGALPMSPVVFDFNFGEQPFALGLPEGFSAFASGLAADEAGDCVSQAGIANDEAPLAATCADETPTSHRTSVDAEDELIVVGIYQSAQGILVDEASWIWESVEGDVHVVIDRPGKRVTVGVTSYEPSHWIVEGTEGTTIAAVFHGGYEAQRVTAPDGVDVTALDQQVIAYAWPSSEGGGDTAGTIRAFEDASGLELTAFAGCYEGTAFSFGPDAS